MIRKLLNGDIDRVADIWLKTNLKAHYFISNQYWKSNYELVKEMMSQYEVYVFEVDKMIQGFVGLNDEYIEAYEPSGRQQRASDIQITRTTKHSLEKAAALNADAFTTVSEVTADEAEQLVGRRPLVTPNGFEPDFVPGRKEIGRAHV